MYANENGTRFLVISQRGLDEGELRAGLAPEAPNVVDFVTAPSVGAARAALQLDETFAAAVLDYQSRSDPEAQGLHEIASLADSVPVVVVVEETDLDAIRRLGRAANASYVVRRDIHSAAMQRALAHARGAFENLHAQIALRRAAQDTARARDKLASSHATLERWAAELEIANARLREVDDLKTKFLSEVSHEIRTPLAAVVSAAKIIMKHHATKPDVVARFGNTILMEGERLTRLINEFLDLTKIEAGCVDWRDAPIDAGHLVEDALAGMAALADERGVELVADRATELAMITADRDRLIQVLTNLLMNALKYTPQGGRVTLRARTEARGVHFEVADTGPGIPASEIGKVFDRFHQVRRTDDQEQGRKGTGLGLCICREIVDHYGGRIWVESDVGRGSVFHVTLPADKSRAAPSMARVDMSRSSHQIRVLLLIPDDDPALGIANAGSTTEVVWSTCSSADEAIDVVSGRRIDVAVASQAFLDTVDDDFLSRIQSYGVAHVLLLTDEHGLVEAGVLENSDAVARSLSAIAPTGSCVMVVEDDENYRKLLEFQLVDEGYRVVAFDNGRDALEALDDVAPDLVVLDLIMPGIDGLTMLHRIRAVDPRLPTVVLTAMDDPAVAVAARELGAIGVFRKDAGENDRYRTVVARVRRLILDALETPRMFAAAS
jgi:signal transduction histidine kinase/CheY-like chemotaxis protein